MTRPARGCTATGCDVNILGLWDGHDSGAALIVDGTVVAAINEERLSRRNLGIVTPDVRLYDHHACHAATAAEGSGFDTCAVVTIDGVGDGLSATVSTFESGRLTRLADTPARHSPGVFFEHITNLLNMRELEDEGKVMALADYASPVPDAENPLLDILRVDGLRFQLTPTGPALLRRLREVLWWFPNEQF